MKLQPQKATQQQIKAYNGQLVLKTIYDVGQISRAEVARRTHLTRTTVSDVVAELQERGLVEEMGRGPSAGGKAPILLSVVADAQHLIGIDLANDEFRGAAVNLRGDILHTIGQPIHSRNGDEALKLVYELVDALLATTGRPVLGIGIGTPGLVDATHGVVLRAVNLDWRDLPLRQLLQARYNLPVYLANDSQAAALAEHMFGRGQNDANLVLIKAGHGIGAGIVINGQLFQGDDFGAGEIGHVVVVENGQQCRCGNFGCLETVASERAIIQRAQALAPSAPYSLLNYLAAAPQVITADNVLQAFEVGDDLARGIVLEAGHFLGIAVANLVGALNIRRIVLGGPVARFGPPLLEAIRQEVLKRSLPRLARETQIELSSLGPDVVILGASALLLTHELGLSLAR